MSDKRSYMALDLVSHEIKETLNHALLDLNGFLENTEDTTKLRFSLTYIHQVSGGLTMIESHGAALLAAEIERLLAFVLSKTISDEAIIHIISTAKLCIEQLSGNISQVIETGEDNPKAFLAPLNAIRSISKSTEEAFSLSDIFNPDITIKASVKNQKPAINANEFNGIVRKLRQHFQRCLVNILKDIELKKNHSVINKVTEALFKSSKNTASEPFWEAAFAITEYLASHDEQVDLENKKALKIIDGKFKELEEAGTKGLMTACDESVFKSLLYCVAVAKEPTDLMEKISQRYDLSEALKPKRNDVDSIKSLSEQFPSLIKESRDKLQGIKEAIVEYVASDWDSQYIVGIPSVLKTLSDHFNDSPFKRLQPICLALFDAIEKKISPVGNHNDWQQLELIADVISAADYYLECLAREEVKNLGDIIRSAYQKLEIIGYRISNTTGEVLLINHQDIVENTAEKHESLNLADDIDDDIFEIFIEEAQEVLETLKTLLPQLHQEKENVDLLREVRRAWHTLKGSGRMVGANQIGGYAWAIENMLNTVLDGNLNFTDGCLDIIDKAIQVLPSMIDALAKKEVIAASVFTDIISKAETFVRQGADVDIEPVKPSRAEVIESHTDIIDDDLYEIFINEAETHINVFIRYLEGIDPGRSDVEVTQELQRAFHTLKGSSHMVGVKPIALLVTPLEALIKDLNNFNIKIDDEILTLFLKASDYLQNIMTVLKDRQTFDLSDIEAFTLELLALQDRKVDKNVDGSKNHYDILLAGAIEHLTLASNVFDIACIQALDRAQKHQVITALSTLALIARENKATSIAELAFALSIYYSNWRNSDEAFSVIQPLVQEAHDALDDMFDSFAAHQIPEPRHALIKALRVAPDDTDLSDLTRHDALAAEIERADNEILEIFVEESTELAEQLGMICTEWLADETEIENLTALKHVLHTLKGGARLAELTTLADAAHAFEKHLERAELYNQFNQEFFAEVNRFQQAIEDKVTFLSDRVNHGEITDNKPPVEPISSSESDRIPEETAESTVDSSADNDSGYTESIIPEQENALPIVEENPSDNLTDPDKVEENTASDLNGDADVELPLLSTPPGKRDDKETAKIIDWNKLSLECRQADEETLEFFVEEAEELLQQLDQAVNHWDSTKSNHENCSFIKRLLHTLKGGARLTELSALGDLTHEYESMIEVAEINERFDDHFFDQIKIYFEVLQRSGDIIFQGGQLPDDSIIEESVTLNKVEPQFIGHHEQTDITGLDTELVELFIEESEGQLEGIDSCIADFINDANNRHPLEELKRLLHTLKGGARMAGIMDMGNLSHDYETYIIQAEREQAVDNDKFIDDIQNYHELMMQHVSKIKDTLVHTQIITHEETESIHTSVSSQQLTQASIDATRSFFHKLNQKKHQQKREPVKVAAGLLENLINLAGESSIGRSRLEEQVNDLNFSVDEMGSTVDRLHGQLRRLEIETEAQIAFRQEQVVSEGQENFDPLEMDRYTQMQQLSKSLIESASDLDDIAETFTGKMRDLDTLLLQQSRLNSELQEGLMRAQMVPFSRMVPRLRRIIRQTATELNKKVEFVVVNGEGEMDRTILDKMLAPLEHMLRNAVDHGIESPEERREKGKQEQGKVTLTLLREGGEIILQLQDDGAGVNLEAVRRTAEERGLLSASVDITDHEICQFILHSGFSTAKQVTQISGRGVGMDVVHSEIKQIGGSVEIDSSPNGTCFTVRLPFTVSVNRALMVCIGHDTYAIPLNTIEGIVRVSPYELESYSQPDAPLFDYAGQSYHLRYLGKLLNNHHQLHLDRITQPVPIILIRSNDYSVAVQVDQLLGSQEIVVKSLGPQFSMVEGLSGATVLGDGSVVVILDMQSLIRADISRGHSEQALAADHYDTRTDEESQLCVMVVDDSVTVRKVTSRLLERHGISVILAKDGLHAMTQLQEMDNLPDLMLLDIEMPRMDGFEVVNRIRHSERLKDIAICMITSRTGKKHRDRALALGANDYLGKPFQESELLQTIEQLTEKV